MRKVIVFFVFCLVALNVRGEGIEFFHGDFNAALAKAKAEKKMLFVDFTATWCGPCYSMVVPKFRTGNNQKKSIIFKH